jgi:molybdopterin-guanine dinucleotide biosynthesis protein A
VTEYLASALKHQQDGSLVKPKQRQYSVKKMLNSLQGLQIPPLKNTQLDNINTPEQWHQRCNE